MRTIIFMPPPPGRCVVRRRSAVSRCRSRPSGASANLNLDRQCIGTLVERHSRHLMPRHLPGGAGIAELVLALTAEDHQLPAEPPKSLTWDHGFEMRWHAKFGIDTGL